MLAELKVFLIAMSPILELRGSIPVALGVFHLPVWSSFLISILGNIVPVVFILLLLESVSNFLSRHSHFFSQFFAWLFERTRRKHAKDFEYWKELALVFFVAIPFPFTGAWTGSLCAFVFGIPFKRALPLIATGVVIAGIVVTLITLGIIQITI
ncbi:MAG: small multi-drug export protein [Candidatus Nealsonbacteria bacterium]